MRATDVPCSPTGHLTPSTTRGTVRPATSLKNSGAMGALPVQDLGLRRSVKSSGSMRTRTLQALPRPKVERCHKSKIGERGSDRDDARPDQGWDEVTGRP